MQRYEVTTINIVDGKRVFSTYYSDGDFEVQALSRKARDLRSLTNTRPRRERIKAIKKQIDAWESRVVSIARQVRWR